MDKLLEALAATAEIMGHELSPTALMFMAKDLQEYDPKHIMQALTNVRKGTAKFGTSAIIAEIELLSPDGRLGADEAWALWPKNEMETAVITNEIAEAMQIANPLLIEGDKIGARMAFKEAYTRIVKQNRANHIKPTWFASLGQDKDGREHVLKQAEAKGLLSNKQVAGLLPSPIHKDVQAVIGHMRMLGKADVLTEQELEKGKNKMAEIKQLLGSKT